MQIVLILVAFLAGVPGNMNCEATAQRDQTTITVVCESEKTGKWFTAVITAATGQILRVTGRVS